MNNYVALLRGVNVGGKNKLSMADLRRALSDVGLQQVQSYIQSGNVVFQSSWKAEKCETLMADVLLSQFSIDVPVMVRSATELKAICKANPFSSHDNLDKALQLFFLSRAATDADTDKLNLLKGDSEAFNLSKACFYLYAPDGIGRSKLAAAAEKKLRVTTTTRNWRTVNNLLEMMP